jgi:peptide/nickel transport system permease protein
MTMLAVALPWTTASSINRRRATQVLPIAIGRPSSTPHRPLPKEAVNAPRQQTASAEIPIASDAQLRHLPRSDGWGSQLVMRLTDVFLAVPQLILALAVAQLMGRGLESAMAALALTYWPFFCRTVYGEVRRLRSALFIEAQRGLGASTSRILFVHVLPNVASAVIVRATIGMGFTIMTTAVLGFLGIGATPPNPDWGLAIAEGREYLPQSWWAVTFPGLGILITVLGFNLFGDGLRDLVDPRLRRSR